MSEEQAAQNPLAASQRLLWDGLPETRKGPKPTLTLDQIVTAAIDIADAGGIDALSMRKLAAELNMSPMALYRYVPGKTELLHLMLDAVEALPADSAPSRDDGWREVLEASAWQGRALHLHHRWLLQVNSTRTPIGPHSLAGMERLMSGLVDMPFSDQEKVMVISMLDGYVTGTARQEILYEQAAEESGLSDGEFWAYQLPLMVQAMESGNYPTMASTAEDAFDGGWEETFALGLKALLDGLEQEVARRQADARVEPGG
ncbi:MAG TPA: TetR/AcrR family transcriptional regulator [Beutenbergiaceae bacterium]|nr:TetR/AcrR family transcriptional regulator [Beutenbergiaceae bacterium]